MKNLSLLNVLLMAFAIFAVSSCTEDDPAGGGGIVLDPSISFVSEAGFLSTDSELAPGETFSVKLRGSTGDNQLNSLTIKDNNVNVDASRITYAHTATANNPQLVVDTDKDGFTWEVSIVAHDDLSDSPYDFIVTDGAGNTAIATIFINTANAGTLGVSLSSGANNCLVTNITATGQTNFCLNVEATRGAFALDQIAVWEDNTLVDASRLSLDANPTTLADGDRNGVTDYEITIQSHADAGTKEYIVEVTDDNGDVVTTSIFVTIGTTVTELTGILLNQAGPAGTGGLDLDDGVGTGSSDANAHIRDQGIDNGLPLDQNWIQKISGVNGSVIRSANNVPEGFKFADIATSEEIQGAFDNGDDLTGGVSDVVAVDDEFLVQNGNQYFYLKVTDINVTAADNADSYTFSIKF